MAVTFTKDLANYATFGIHGLGSLLNGSDGVSVSFAFKVTSLSGGGDDIVYIWMNDSTFILRVFFNGTAIECDCKSSVADTFPTTQLGVNNRDDGKWHFQSFGHDLVSGDGAVFSDGVGSQGAGSFPDSAFATVPPTTNYDSLGSRGGTPVPTSTNRQFDGLLAHFAIWDTYLSRGELQSLGSGYDPLLIRPSRRIYYLPLNRDKLDGANRSDPLTFTGSLPFVDSPTNFKANNPPQYA